MNITGNGKMDWFFSEWVYGTAIPKYKFDYTVTEHEGKFLLKGSITQSEVPADFVMIVPIYLDFDGQISRLGSARLRGSTRAADPSGVAEKTEACPAELLPRRAGAV